MLVQTTTPIDEGNAGAREQYAEIWRGATVLRIVAYIWYFVAAAALVAACIRWAIQPMDGSSGWDFITGLLSSLGAFAFGAILAMLASLAEAVRDIARNTFPR